MRFAFLLLGLALLVVFLDFLADGDEVLKAGGGAVDVDPALHHAARCPRSSPS